MRQIIYVFTDKYLNPAQKYISYKTRLQKNSSPDRFQI